jgi:pyridinium-3,5-bisthiocarboxylic acid mononucleotide nickel chelatase
MRIAYLECFSGISGDMFLGTLIDAGVSPELFEKTVETLNVDARLEISRVNRSGISATKVDVVVNGHKYSPRVAGEPPAPREQGSAAGQGGEGGSDVHSHSHSHHPEHHHERGLTEIREIISKAALKEEAKRIAIAIFDKLGEAEAKIHNVPIERVHFHEVGAVDALVDIVCAAVGAEALSVDEFVCSPLNVGGGMVECAHGTFPVPAPATVELLKGAPVYSSGIQAELVTPTGAAIVAMLAKRFTSFPEMKVEQTGYGAGSRDFAGYPNVLRITVGESVAQTHADKSVRATQSETIAVLEANLDDLSPQVFGYVIERLLEAGALDVFATPVQMKKNRPGSLLTVLAKPEDADKLTQIIFAETTTLGVRQREEVRQILPRRWATVSTSWGDVRIKVASMNGSLSNYAPEYEDCRRIATEQKVPLRKVMMEAMEAYTRSLKG